MCPRLVVAWDPYLAKILFVEKQGCKILASYDVLKDSVTNLKARRLYLKLITLIRQFSFQVTGYIITQGIYNYYTDV